MVVTDGNYKTNVLGRPGTKKEEVEGEICDLEIPTMLEIGLSDVLKDQIGSKLVRMSPYSLWDAPGTP